MVNGHCSTCIEAVAPGYPGKLMNYYYLFRQEQDCGSGCSKPRSDSDLREKKPRIPQTSRNPGSGSDPIKTSRFRPDKDYPLLSSVYV